MLSADLITYFYREIKDKERAEDRLHSFIQYTQDLIAGTFVGQSATEEKEVLSREFATWTLILNLFEADQVDTSEQQNPSQFHKLEENIRLNRDLLIFIKLETWLEQIKEVHITDRHVVDWTRSVVSMSQRITKNSQELDPDAGFRGPRDIDPSDITAERDMVKFGFEYIRAGKLRDAQILFSDCGQPWRAASIGGLLPFFDFKQRFRVPVEPQVPSFMKSAEFHEMIDTYQQRTEDEFDGLMGNAHLRLYIYAMWRLAEATKYEQREDSAYERALYGSLCGHYEAMSCVCRGNFYDHFWALVRAAVFMCMDGTIPEDDFEPCEREAVRINYPASWPRSFEGIARKLHSCHPSDTKDPFASFQLAFITSFILGDWNSCIDSLVVLDEHYANHHSPGIVIHLARFCTHAAVIIVNAKSLDVERKMKVDRLILEYIRLVLNTKNPELGLVSHYIRYIRNPTLPVLKELVVLFVDEIKAGPDAEPIQRELSRYYQTYLTPIVCEIVQSDTSQLRTYFDHKTALQKIFDMERGAMRLRNLLDLFPPHPNSGPEFATLLETARETVLTGLIDTGEILLQGLNQGYVVDPQVDWLQKVVKSVQLYRRFLEIFQDKPSVEDISSGYDPRAVIHRGIVGQIYQKYQDWPVSLQKQGEVTGAALLELIQGCENVKEMVTEEVFLGYQEGWVRIFREWLTEVRNVLVEHRQ